jgi:hypothetical protein
VTHLVGKPRAKIPRAWLIPLAMVVAMLISVAAGAMSRAIVVDFLAWWPVWLALALVTFLGRGRRWGPVRLSGLIPILAASALVVFAVGYYSSWSLMPSAIVRLRGPVIEEVEAGSISARIAGDLEVAAITARRAYTAEPLRGGGRVGIPTATERVQGASFSVSIAPDPEAGVYRFSGWRIGLSDRIPWGLTLEGELDVDLRGLDVTELRVTGGGVVTLGTTASEVSVSVDGPIRVILPPTSVARVIGEASVPGDWIRDGDGWSSPGNGPGWVFSTSPGAALTIRYP